MGPVVSASERATVRASMRQRWTVVSRWWRRPFLGVAVSLAAVLPLGPGAIQAGAYTCSSVPVGQANPSAEPEPMQPIWCAGPQASEPSTRVVDQWGGWQDSFQTNVQMGAMTSDYRIFDGLTAGGSTVRSQHFVNNNHWMVDMSRDNGGALMSPTQAFRFENGKLVIEGDVAAGIPGYFDSGGDLVWPEIVWSTAPKPTGKVVDGLYAYGQFGGAWASGCRMNGERDLICSLEADHNIPTNGDTAPCFSEGATRVWELSGFEYCGAAHSGFAVDFGAPAAAWRECQPNQMDMYCRDRFRFEWSQSGFVAYLNGVKFAEDSGWPGYAQIPSSIVNGSTPVYAYFGEWGDFTDANVYRFHWGRVAVNPHDTSGAIVAPSAAPSYCPSDPQQTCPMGSTSPMPGTDPSSMPAPMPTPTSTPMPTPTPTPTPTRTPTPTPTPSGTGSPAAPPLSGFRSVSTSTDSGTVTGPAGVQPGDLLLAALEVDRDPVRVTPPPGWRPLLDTQAAAGTPSAFHAMLFWKLAGTAEPGAYTFSVPRGVWTDVQVLAYAGVYQASPIDVAAGRDAGTTSRPSTAALTTTAPGDRLVAVFIGYVYGTWTPPATMTMRSDFDANMASDKLLGLPGIATAKLATTTGRGPTAALAVAIRYH
jgi:hypothetical protein